MTRRYSSEAASKRMSIDRRIAEFLSQFRMFNPHLKHGFVSGPDRSHFWLDLGWAYKDLEFHGRKLHDPARATAEEVFSYLYNLQYYEILRVSTYRYFGDAVTVGDQLEKACQRVKSEVNSPQYIHQNRNFEAACKKLLASATDIAAEAIMKRFEKLNRPIAKCALGYNKCAQIARHVRSDCWRNRLVPSTFA